MYIRALDALRVVKSFGAQRTSTRRTFLTLVGIFVTLSIAVLRGSGVGCVASEFFKGDFSDDSCIFEARIEAIALGKSSEDGGIAFGRREGPVLDGLVTDLAAAAGRAGEDNVACVSGVVSMESSSMTITVDVG